MNTTETIIKKLQAKYDDYQDTCNYWFNKSLDMSLSAKERKEHYETWDRYVSRALVAKDMLDIAKSVAQPTSGVVVIGDNKRYIAHDLGCIYRWNTEWNVLEWTPLTADADDFGAVQEDAVGEEIVTFMGTEMSLSDVFRHVEKELGVK